MHKIPKRIWKIPETKGPNEEFSLDFAGPYQNALKQKNTC